jgi:hypothetical protein
VKYYDLGDYLLPVRCDQRHYDQRSPDQTAETKTQVTLNSAFVSLPCLGGPRLVDGYPGGRVRQIDSVKAREVPEPGETD